MKLFASFLLLVIAWALSFLLNGCSLTFNADFGPEGLKGGNIGVTGKLPEPKGFKK